MTEVETVTASFLTDGSIAEAYKHLAVMEDGEGTFLGLKGILTITNLGEADQNWVCAIGAVPSTGTFIGSPDLADDFAEGQTAFEILWGMTGCFKAEDLDMKIIPIEIKTKRKLQESEYITFFKQSSVDNGVRFGLFAKHSYLCYNGSVEEP